MNLLENTWRNSFLPLELGNVSGTIGIDTLTGNQEGASEEVLGFLERHRSGDWGEVCRGDATLNDLSLRSGDDRDRILSAYRLEDGERIWIITEADRSVTTILTPEEY